MLKFDNISKHNFLGPSWYHAFKKVGVNMAIDASYYLVKDNNDYFIYDKNEFIKKFGKGFKYFSKDTVIPTYTIADMLYKIDEWPFDHDQDKSIPDENKKPWQGINFFKDAPFYGFYYAPELDDKDKTGDPEQDKKLKDEKFPFYKGKHCIEAISESPLIALALLMYICAKHKTGYIGKHNISDKYKELKDFKLEFIDGNY